MPPKPVVGWRGIRGPVEHAAGADAVVCIDAVEVMDVGRYGSALYAPFTDSRYAGIKSGPTLVVFLFCVDERGTRYTLHVRGWAPSLLVESDALDDLELDDAPFTLRQERLRGARRYVPDPDDPNTPLRRRVWRASAPTLKALRKTRRILGTVGTVSRSLRSRPAAQMFTCDTGFQYNTWIRVRAPRIVTRCYVSHDQVELACSLADLEAYTGAPRAPLRLLASVDIETVHAADRAESDRLQEHGINRFANAKVASNAVTIIGLRIEWSDGSGAVTEVHTTSDETYAPSADFHIVYHKTEEAMILAVHDVLTIRANVDIIHGYNIHNYDYPYLVLRAARTLGPKSRFWRPGRMLASCVYTRRHPHGCKSRACDTGCRCTLVDCAGDDDEDGPQWHAPQRTVLDLLAYGKGTLQASNAEWRFTSWKLDNVAKALLGIQKDDVPGHLITHYWFAGGQMRHKLIAYCARDVELPARIILDRAIIAGIESHSRVCNTDMDRIIHGGSLEISANRFDLRLRALGAFFDEGVTYPAYDVQGGKVYKPIVGVYTEGTIFSIDFNSLYPNLMQQFNLCASAYVGTVTPEGSTVPPATQALIDSGRLAVARYEISDARAHVFATATKGIICQEEEELIAWRKEEKGLLKAAKRAGDLVAINTHNGNQLAIKIVCNTYYGYFCVGPRVHELTGVAKEGCSSAHAVAESITAMGRKMLERAERVVLGLVPDTHAIVERLRAQYGDPGEYASAATRIVYGDTDSVFVELALPRAWRAARKQIVYEISQLACDAIRMGKINMELEKISEVAVFLNPKMYSITYVETPDGPVERVDKGIVTARRDRSRACTTLYGQVLDMLHARAAHAAIEAHIRRHLKRVATRALPVADYTITKVLRKMNESLPHVQVAQATFRRTGVAPCVGDAVPYVVARRAGARVPRGDVAKRAFAPGHLPAGMVIDTEYYLTNQIRNVMTRLLACFLSPDAIDDLFSTALNIARGQREIRAFFKKI